MENTKCEPLEIECTLVRRTVDQHHHHENAIQASSTLDRKIEATLVHQKYSRPVFLFIWKPYSANFITYFHCITYTHT